MKSKRQIIKFSRIFPLWNIKNFLMKDKDARGINRVKLNDSAFGIGKFTAHNIRLDDGKETFPAMGDTMDKNPFFLSTKRMLELIFPEGLSGKSIVDLGCLEGGYAVEFARLGMESTGIEVRNSNFLNCKYVKDNVHLPNLHFIKDDAWNLAHYGPFDVIFCSGLLYHMEKPVSFLKLLSSQCRKALFINTHFSRSYDSPGKTKYKLSKISENENVRGRWYFEHNNAQFDELDKMKWTSWANSRSFWIQYEYLIQAIKDAGFDIVLEQFDALGDDILHPMLKGGYRYECDRSMFVCIKSQKLKNCHKRKKS